MEWRKIICSPYCDLPPGQKHVLTTLSMYGDKWGDDIFPGQRTLANRAGVTLKTVNAVLQRAEREGWIIRKEKDRPYGKGYISHCYTLAIPDYLSDHMMGKSNLLNGPFRERFVVEGRQARLESLRY